VARQLDLRPRAAGAVPHCAQRGQRSRVPGGPLVEVQLRARILDRVGVGREVAGATPRRDRGGVIVAQARGARVVQRGRDAVDGRAVARAAELLG
jgi:hypothetical protein